MAAIASQKAAFAGQAVARRSAIRAPASRSAVVVRAAADRKLWAPGVEAPAYLNGDMAGDYGQCSSAC
jgi:light-harvesting complex I chlorophyll a/b binding protein 4